MARKSRKATQQLCEPESKQRIFNAALYVRLSNEERFNRANKNSFKTQKALLFDFVEKHPDINVYKVYEDNGYTGTNFDRPGFSDMMYDQVHHPYQDGHITTLRGCGAIGVIGLIGQRTIQAKAITGKESGHKALIG